MHYFLYTRSKYANIKLGASIKEYNLNTVGMAIISDMRSS